MMHFPNKKYNIIYWQLMEKIKCINASVRQLVINPIRKHSRKPDIIRDLIVKLVGDLPRIELFARQKVEGWDCWGDMI